jgi:CRP-like cAMP-binding protein
MAAVQYQSETVHYEAGQIIALQGNVLKDILILKKGTVEVKQCIENIKGFLDFEIIEKSKFLKEISSKKANRFKRMTYICLQIAKTIKI